MTSKLPIPSESALPRWRGFNLQEKFTIDRPECNASFREDDFDLVTAWGFDFVRLAMDYRTWTDDGDQWAFLEPALRDIDQAVEWGAQYGVHVDINFHRAPGYCVNLPREPLNLWTDPWAQDLCAHHWAMFAERYRGIPNERLSFNLLNEPKEVEDSAYIAVVERLTGTIKECDPERLVIADGLDLGWTPVSGLAEMGVAQSLHAYDPWAVSHYGAPWFPGAQEWEEPSWPLRLDGSESDRHRLAAERIEPWKALERMNVGVHVGEFGTYNQTPHHVTLAWMEDFLQLFQEAGWGWAIWNLRGAYGPLDSRRNDVRYEPFHEHQLDREMLDLLQRY